MKVNRYFIVSDSAMGGPVPENDRSQRFQGFQDHLKYGHCGPRGSHTP